MLGYRATRGIIDGGVYGAGHIATEQLAGCCGNAGPRCVAQDDAAAFLLERTANRLRPSADEAQSQQLAVELGRLALALE